MGMEENVGVEEEASLPIVWKCGRVRGRGENMLVVVACVER